MLKGDAKKTKSARRLIFLSVMSVALVSSALIVFIIIQPKITSAPPFGQNSPIVPKAYCLRLSEPDGKSECPLGLEVADSNQARTRGLSGRAVMATNKGMIFVFDKSSEQCFWMKEMQFSIDMIWVGEDMKIVKIEKNVTPDTYPNSFCNTAKYVVELNSGQSDAMNLSPGQQLFF